MANFLPHDGESLAFRPRGLARQATGRGDEPEGPRLIYLRERQEAQCTPATLWLFHSLFYAEFIPAIIWRERKHGDRNNAGQWWLRGRAGRRSRKPRGVTRALPALSRKPLIKARSPLDTSAFRANTKGRMAENPELSRHFCIPCQDQAESDTKHRSVATLPHSAPAPEAGWQRVQICRDTSVFHARIKPKVARNTDLSRHFRILCQAETRVAESLELSRRFWVVRRRQKPGGRKNRTVATDAPEDLCLIIAVGMQVACR